MKYRHLGATGLQVSEIGFGTWGLGGNSYGPVDDAVAMKTLCCAFDAGITFYDTSDLYGNGHSEELLGAALRRVRDRIVICTKVGLLPHTGFEMPFDFSPRHIRAGLEASLKRLQTDYVDLYLLHSPTLDILRRDDTIAAVLMELRRAGQIRSYGISARSPDDALAAVREFGFSAAQVNFNLIDQRAIDNGFLSYAAEAQVGVIARTPLCFGYLTGKMTGEETFQGIDHRSNWPAEQLKRWAAAPDLFAFLNNGTQRTPAQLALRFCLDHPSISTVIPGMMQPREVVEDAAAVDLPPLESDELERIRLIYQTHTFFDQRAKKGK
jgi:aryl-alcohol dehydrogenase-like predicted oxidoreductase